MNYFEDPDDEEGIECFIGDVLARASQSESDEAEESTAEEEEGIEWFHIGDIFARLSDVDDSSDEASMAAQAAYHNHNSKKKKLIYLGASVIAVSIAIATGVLVSRQSNTQKRVAAASLNAGEEIPWFACLDKQSCFRQASLLGFTDLDRRSGDYAYASLYGCFLKDRLVYWGEGGTEEQMITREFQGVQQRIWCYDVNPNPDDEVDICGNPIPNLPSGTPSNTPSTFRPSTSSQPSPIPTSSLRPSISTKPSASPSTSEPSASPSSSEPSASPSISFQPSTSSQPSDKPSISANPSTYPSGQPSSAPSR